MTALTSLRDMTGGDRRPVGGISPLIMAILVWTVIAAALLFARTSALERGFLDTDDAARLVQVRTFLETGAWFDTSLPRFGTSGLLSHWSRLVDLPIAVLISLLSIVLPVATAELVAQAVWPLLLLLPAMGVLAVTVDRLAGRTAAAFALVFMATALPASLHFLPGRIDHHNAMIVTALASIFLMAAASDINRIPVIAGVCAGLCLAIGFEALPLVAISSVALVIWALIDERQATAVVRYCFGLAGSLAVFFVSTVPPTRWLDVHCDALSLNLVVLAAAGAAGAALALTTGRSWSIPARLFALAAAGGTGLAAYLALEPACLAGPFGQVPAAIKPIWLDHVSETRSLLWHIGQNPSVALPATIFFVGAAMAYALILKSEVNAKLGYLAALFGAAVVLTLWQFKFLSYATWLAIPGLAVFVARLRAPAALSPLTVQCLAFVLLSPIPVTLATAALAKSKAPATATQNQACRSRAVVGALDQLPPGLVVSHTDLGPFIVAATRHRALSGPYHRLPDGILAAHTIFAASPERAASNLAEIGAAYVVDCAGMPIPKIESKAGSGTLLSALRSDRGPPGLIDVTPEAAKPLRVWRVESRQ